MRIPYLTFDCFFQKAFFIRRYADDSDLFLLILRRTSPRFLEDIKASGAMNFLSFNKKKTGDFIQSQQ